MDVLSGVYAGDVIFRDRRSGDAPFGAVPVEAKVKVVEAVPPALVGQIAFVHGVER